MAPHPVSLSELVAAVRVRWRAALAGLAAGVGAGGARRAGDRRCRRCRRGGRGWWWGWRPAPAEPFDHPACDVVVVDGSAAFEAIESTMGTNPLAATAVATLLRGAAARTVTEGLLAESAVYSALQAGPEFHAWRASRPPRHAW